jgi:hypothetical protein
MSMLFNAKHRCLDRLHLDKMLQALDQFFKLSFRLQEQHAEI